MTQRAIHRFLASRSATVGATIILALSSAALIGPPLCSHSPLTSDFSFGIGPFSTPAPPSSHHLLGTDTLYRDILSRLLSGARLSLLIGLLATVLSTFVGTSVGLLSGYCANTKAAAIDKLMMRIVDAGLAFPYLLLVMALGTALDRSDLTSIVLVLGATGWLGTSRIVRSRTILIRQLDYVTAARALGQRHELIMLRHILPNLAGPVLITATTSVASMILAESVLSYLSVGVAPPTPTWGRMLREGQTFFTADPRLVAVPALAILLAVLGFNLLGEGLRDVLDPHET
jgi:ABC-type dipeptide/oligopeptide/nickel transport system permease subunit